MSPLLMVYCHCCSIIFHICRSCYRGQVYCCPECRKAGQRQRHNEAQKDYRKTEKGKKNHREAEKRRRKRNKIKGWISKAAKKTCICLQMTLKMLCGKDDALMNSPPRCHCCGKQGRPVERFESRGYGYSYSQNCRAG